MTDRINNEVLEATVVRLEKLINPLLDEVDRLNKIIADRDAEIDALLNGKVAAISFEEFEKRAMLALNTSDWQVPFARQTGIARQQFRRYRTIGYVPSDVVTLLDKLKPHEAPPKVKWDEERRAYLKELYTTIKTRDGFDNRVSTIGKKMKERFGVEFPNTSIESTVSRMVKSGDLPRAKDQMKAKKSSSPTSATVLAAA